MNRAKKSQPIAFLLSGQDDFLFFYKIISFAQDSAKF